MLSTVDALVLTEVYPAGEAPIVAADGRALARAVRVQGKVEPVFVETIAELPAAILRSCATATWCSRWARARSAACRRSSRERSGEDGAMEMTEPRQFDVSQLRGSLREDEPMARHVSWRAGGRAARAYVPADLDDLQAFLPMLPPHEPVCFVGLGSNLLVRDGGFAGPWC